jgi:hypothetical protein
MQIKILALLSIVALIFSGCLKDNFPTMPTSTSKPTEDNAAAEDYCKIVLDSIVIDTSSSYLMVHWYGYIQNPSELKIAFPFANIRIATKLYTDSTKTIIIQSQSEYFNIADFLPGERQLFHLQTWLGIDTASYPNFYPDSVWISK